MKKIFSIAKDIAKKIKEAFARVFANATARRISIVLVLLIIGFGLYLGFLYVRYSIQELNSPEPQATAQPTISTTPAPTMTESTPTPTRELSIKEIEDQLMVDELKKFTSGSEKKQITLPLSNHKITVPSKAAVTSVIQKITPSKYGDITSDSEGTCLSLGKDLTIDTTSVPCRYDRVEFDFWTRTRLTRKFGSITVYYDTYPSDLTNLSDSQKASLTAKEITFMGRTVKHTIIDNKGFIITTINSTPVTILTSGNETLSEVLHTILATF